MQIFHLKQEKNKAYVSRLCHVTAGNMANRIVGFYLINIDVNKIW